MRRNSNNFFALHQLFPFSSLKMECECNHHSCELEKKKREEKASLRTNKSFSKTQKCSKYKAHSWLKPFWTVIQLSLAVFNKLTAFQAIMFQFTKVTLLPKQS